MWDLRPVALLTSTLSLECSSFARPLRYSHPVITAQCPITSLCDSAARSGPVTLTRPSGGWQVETGNALAQLGACHHSAAQTQSSRNPADMPQPFTLVLLPTASLSGLSAASQNYDQAEWVSMSGFLSFAPQKISVIVKKPVTKQSYQMNPDSHPDQRLQTLNRTNSTF